MKDIPQLQWVVGGVDLSLNDDSQKGLGIGWQPQIYAIASGDAERLKGILRGRYKRTITTSRPVRIDLCDGSAPALSYAYKTEFVRRVANYTFRQPSKGGQLPA